MDINEKIAQRRRELEAQRVIDAPIEKEIVQRAVQKNLEKAGFEAVHAHPVERKSRVIQAPDLHKKIEEETDKALDKIASARLTTGEKFKTGLLVVLGLASCFGSLVIGVGFFFWAGWYFDKKVKAHRYQMKVDQESIRVARETFSTRDTDVTQPVPEVIPQDDGLKYAKKQVDIDT